MTYDYSRDEEAWAANEPEPYQEPERNPPPPGTYVCEIVSAKMNESHNSGYAELKIGARIVDGDHAGKMCWPSGNLDPAPLPSTGKPPVLYLRQLVERLGYKGTASGLPAAAQGFVGAKVEIAAVQSGKWMRYYLNKRLDDPEIPGEPDEEPIPF